MQRAILDILWSNNQIKNIVKNQETKNSFGGIKDESTKKAITELCKCIGNGYNYYIASDIRDFFQKIPRDVINKSIFNFLQDDTINAYIEKAAQCEILNASSKQIRKYINLFPKGDVGVVQGCCLSPLYGNIYLHDFDQEINSIKDIRCIRYIDDFIVLGKREKKVKIAFNRAIGILRSKGLDAYMLKEKNTKAEFGDIRKIPLNFLGCSITKGQVRPRDKARIKLLEKVDKLISDSVTKINSTQGNVLIKENYINTIITINNTLKGWGGAFSFCNDKMFFKRLDMDIMKKIVEYHALYKKISSKIMQTEKRQRIFGLQMLADCTDKDPIYGNVGTLS